MGQTLTLNSGDSVTVSGAGTVGTIGGKAVNNKTTTYNDSVPASGSAAVVANGTSNFALGPGGTLLDGVLSGLEDVSSGSVTVSGGSITGAQYGLLDTGGGGILVSGGNITGGGYGVAAQQGTVTIVGGSITGEPFGGVGLLAEYGGTIDLFSKDDTPFLIGGVSMNNETLPINMQDITISGILLNGDHLNTTFTDVNFGTINLNVGKPPTATPSPPSAAVPEPSSFALLGLALPALGVLVRRRVRK